jgi:hypothetical protein
VAAAFRDRSPRLVDRRRCHHVGLALDDSTWIKARGWTPAQALGALSYYAVDTNAVLVRERRRWLAAVLADHESSGS